MSTTGISLCMIVKDEEQHLARCLSSAQPICDEIIIVDTGSRDRTVAIATEYGARVEFFPWCDDFSAARNYSLQFAIHDWILQLDADESLYEGDHDQIRRSLADERVTAYELEILNDLAGGGVATFRFPRLFRNGRGIRYEGKVHNQLRFDGEATPSSIRIHHVGYDLDGDCQLRKFQRRAPLLETQIKENPDDPFPHFNLAMFCHLTGSFARGARLARAAVERSTVAELRLAALDLEGLCLHRAGESRHAVASLREALELDPDFIDALFDLGSVLLDCGDADGARSCYERYFEALPTWRDRPSLSNLMLRSLNSTAMAWNNLGCARRRLGDLVGACEAYESALADDPGLGPAAYNLGITLAGRGDLAAAVAPLERARELQGDRPDVLRSLGLVLTRLGREDEARQLDPSVRP